MSLLSLNVLDWINDTTSNKKQSYELKTELSGNIAWEDNIWKCTTLPLLITDCLRRGDFSLYGDKCKEETEFYYNRLNIKLIQGSSSYNISLLPKRVKALC